MRIVIAVNKRKEEKYRQILKENYEGITVDVVALTEDSMIACFKEKDVALFLICVENCSDLMRYFEISKRVDKSRHLFWTSKRAKIFQCIIRKKKGKNVSFAGNTGVKTIEELINILNQTSSINLNCDDVLKACENGIISCSSHRGTMESVLESIKLETKRNKGSECCLVDIDGDLTFKDIEDIWSTFPSAEDARVSLGYSDIGEARVFLLWRKGFK